MRTLLATLVAASVLAVPSTSLAHPVLDEAQRRFGEADLEGALVAYAEAERADDLSLEQLIELYAGRALVHHTVGDREALDLDLFRLATLSPEHEFGRQVPPVVRQAFARVKEHNRVTSPISVEIDADSAPGGVRIEARVEDDLAAIVRVVVVAMRTPGNAWRRRTNAALEFPVTSDQTVEYYAEAMGPGGAVVASSGTAAEPLRVVARALVNPTSPVPHIPEEEDQGGDASIPLWPFLVGGAVVAAGGVLLAVLLAGGSDDTRLDCCSFEGP